MERYELYRLATFSSWPANANVSPLTLARIGFFYVGPEDTVRCESCNIVLDHLEKVSCTLERHAERSPGCPFVESASSTPSKSPPELASAVGGVTATDGDVTEIGLHDSINILLRILSSAIARATKHGVFSANGGCDLAPSGSGVLAGPQGSSTQGHAFSRSNQPDYEQLQHEESRWHTFCNWPVTACVDSHALAKGGFFYTGQGDRVQCAYCRGYLKNWKATDIIHDKHKKYSPNCSFLSMVDSERSPQRQTIEPSSHNSAESPEQQEATINDDPVSSMMDREEVRILLPVIQNLGFSENDLRTVVAERLSRGEDCLVSTKLFEAVLCSRSI